jgi:superfamily II DNA/RNA helicase
MEEWENDGESDDEGMMEDEGLFAASPSAVEGFNTSAIAGMSKASVGKSKKKSTGFQALGLNKQVFGGVMRLGYKIPTPIQRATLPIALSGSFYLTIVLHSGGKL